ncbi:hypothetical protein AA309_20025 [Microvirga vignae]|uniref:Uncharacterized protein n=1 Tax=Microvirga vignae TaxID=1225564 RepID=A0A0H1RFM5_9HYPH|nr:hypothetical protein [Microvirga vignae]KLK91392.1 hypothetical protein AA309_20025 [Microvirga vignae]
MTPQEIKAQCRALADLVGPQAELTVWIDEGRHRPEQSGRTIGMSLYPNGITGRSEGTLYAYADTWEEAFANMRIQWDARAASFHKAKIRAMALKIIEITQDWEVCSEARLRAFFDPGEIEQLGPLALEQANRMAANGPFTIEPSPAGNRRDGDTDEEGR